MEKEQTQSTESTEHFVSDEPVESRIDMEIRRTLRRAGETAAYYHGQSAAYCDALRLVMYALTVAIVMIVFYKRFVTE